MEVELHLFIVHLCDPIEKHSLCNHLHVLPCSCRLKGEVLQDDRNALLNKLMEIEKDGREAANQVSALRESVFRLCNAGGSVSVSLLLIISKCFDN